MIRQPTLVFATADVGLLVHWQGAFGKTTEVVVTSFLDLQGLVLHAASLVWLDLALPGLAQFGHRNWASLVNHQTGKFVATSSNPTDSEAIQALDAGCAGYCHAFSDAATLHQVKQVVEAGQVWVGVSLMRRLVQSAAQAAPKAPKNDASWGSELTEREQEVALLAANGASNIEIARHCSISERTVKAHLSSVFGKLHLTDRLQLALRVHGIS
jgi:DNA-binding NarL/FixJ family response regulator